MNTEVPAPAEGTGSMVEQAYRLMRQRILDNAWPPGYRALEQVIAETLGMSRTPVREALIRLQREGRRNGWMCALGVVCGGACLLMLIKADALGWAAAID